MSTYGATLNFLKQNIDDVTESEYIPDEVPGSLVGGIINQDVQSLTFDDCSFDLIMSNQVFEHVPDGLMEYKECYRVLRPGGSLIFTVPLSDVAETKRLAEIVNNRLVFHEQPEYYDSRLGGPKSALAFWRHSKHDICARVASVGFTASLQKIFVTPNQGTPSYFVHAVKSQQCSG